MNTAQVFLGSRRLIRKLRWIHVAPLLAAITLGAWALASPVGASPDDDYHLVSAWCAVGGSDECAPGTTENQRVVSTAFTAARCYAMDATKSAACQGAAGLEFDGTTYQTRHGNFVGRYPDVYYSAMHIFAGDELVQSALVMRFVNLTLFVGLVTALAVLLPQWRRQTLLWGWLVTLVPLGMFLISSNNPSGWAVTGVGTAFLALLGWFESSGRRRWALGALYVVGIVMSAGSRHDGSVYAAGATCVVLVLTASRTRAWLYRALLPLVGLIVIALLFSTVTQSAASRDGFPDTPAVVEIDGITVTPPVAEAKAATVTPPVAEAKVATVTPPVAEAKAATVTPPVAEAKVATVTPPVAEAKHVGNADVGVSDEGAGSSGGIKLAAYNLLMLPYLWTGVWGTWALGWFDTELPPIVPWAGSAAFIAVALAGFGSLDKRKALAVAGVLAVLVLLPVYLLTAGGDAVGTYFSPRYLLPLIVLFSLLLVTVPSGGRTVRFTRLQTFILLAALATANLVSLATNIRRYVTGVDEQRLNLDSGVEWWWQGLSVGPMAVWVIGSAAFVALLAVLWPELRRKGITAP